MCNIRICYNYCGAMLISPNKKSQKWHSGQLIPKFELLCTGMLLVLTAAFAVVALSNKSTLNKC